MTVPTETETIQATWTCPGCDVTYFEPKPDRFIDETWTTIGGGTIRYAACFTCRRLIAPPFLYGIDPLADPGTTEAP